MRDIFTLKRLLLALAALLLVLLGVVAQEFRLFERAWFNLQQWQQADQLDPNSLRLGDYEVEIEAKVIAGQIGRASCRERV